MVNARHGYGGEGKTRGGGGEVMDPIPSDDDERTNDDEGVGDTARMLTWAFRNAALKLK